MKLINTKIKDGPKIIKSIKYSDKRGFLKETFKKTLLKGKDFPFDIMSFSKRDVLRGLHIQLKKSQAKIITVTHGKIFDVAVDLRKNSKNFGKFFSCVLSEKNSKSVYIPPGFAHGFCGLDKENYIIYSCTQYRNAKSEKAIKYNDKKLNIKWPSKKPIVSKKDQAAITFLEFKKKYLK